MEIGSFLELQLPKGRELYSGEKNIARLNTGRMAIWHAFRITGCQRIWIPIYQCDSIRETFERKGVEICFYYQDSHFNPINIEAAENDAVLLVNYYGVMSNSRMAELSGKYAHPIIDCAQAFFCKPIENALMVYSCRKFVGVPDGAYLVSDCGNLELDTDVSMDRMKHLLGRFEGLSASDYYSDFQRNDEMFDALPMMYMSKLTRNLMGVIDYDKFADKREENWDTLSAALSDTNKLSLIKPKGPYMYPYYCENGAEIRKNLIAKKIFIPTLWPNVMDFDGCENEKKYAQNILPLPVDQRYSKSDMDVIVEEIKKWQRND